MLHTPWSLVLSLCFTYGVLLSIIDLMVIDCIYPIIQGISTAIVFVRVEMGLSYDDDNGSLKTDIRFERNKNITTTTQSFGHLDIEC